MKVEIKIDKTWVSAGEMEVQIQDMPDEHFLHPAYRAMLQAANMKGVACEVSRNFERKTTTTVIKNVYPIADEFFAFKKMLRENHHEAIEPTKKKEKPVTPLAKRLKELK